MSTKLTDDEIPEMIDECILHAERRGRDPSFLRSLQDWYEDKGFLTDKQYEALAKNYDDIL